MNESRGIVDVDQFPNPTSYRTIQLHMSNFKGTIIIHGSIKENPTDEDWFEIHKQEHPERTGSMYRNFVNVQGCFLWMKAEVDLISGQLGRISIR